MKWICDHCSGQFEATNVYQRTCLSCKMDMLLDAIDKLLKKL